MTAERSTTPTADEWWLEDQPVRVADTYTPETGEIALMYLSDNLHDLDLAIQGTDTTLGDSTRFLVEKIDTVTLIDTIALIQSLRRRLGVAEAYLAREIGRMTAETGGAVGSTSDGRQYEVLKGAVRKAWDHEGWQAAVRRVVAEQAPQQVIDASTGEVIDIQTLVMQAMTRAQAVHGSSAPKVTALKALALDAGDYCETSPGPYAVKVTTTTTGA